MKGWIVMTDGMIMFYGGIAGMGLSVLLLILLIPIFSFKKKKLTQKINKEFDER